MSYNESAYLILFLPITLIIYNLVSKKYRKWVLLISSYIFFGFFSGKLIFYLIISTLSIHHLGIWINHIYKSRDIEIESLDREKKKEVKQKAKHKALKVVLLGLLIHLGILICLKYTPFFLTNINSLFELLNIDITFEIPKFLVPIGISFYTFEALSYIIDVYNEKIDADYSLMNLALYLAFFPQIMEGPIARYNETVPELTKCEKSSAIGIRKGLLRIGYGLIKKGVIADRLSYIVGQIFDNYTGFDGGMIFIGAILYTIQLYTDFSGIIDIVNGSSECFGIKLPENFRQPFFSKNISEFWTRWHITLGKWFKDYIFYPILLSKPIKKLITFAKKHIGNTFGPILVGGIALFCVWISNGLWHGAGWNYIFFGIYHFVLIMLGNIIDVFIKRFNEKHKINRDAWYIKFVRIIKTSFLVVIGEMFFRASDLTSGFTMFKKIFTDFSFKQFLSGELFIGNFKKFDLLMVIFTLILIFIIGILKEKKIDVREKIESKPFWFRWAIYYAIIAYLILFGAYGVGYGQIDPMYANF